MTTNQLGRGGGYDAFISYSHGADDLMAPRLQAGLQRFAKPWWRRRAMRVFRDESSLSASPHLWDSITEALDSASWFVLLLSPEAAGSEWVNREIEYWMSDPARSERVLPVVTDGEFGWDSDVVGSAVPPQLAGVFASEPRWVDLRFARGETQLDLKNSAFAGAVADVASAVRGIPKDELESEEVRQHRRTIRTAWAAGIVVLLLGVAASIAAVFAINEQARANENAVLASQEADRANLNAAEAESQRAAADALAQSEAEARQAAERAASLALARQWVLEAERSLNSDPELSIHLALHSLDVLREAGEDLTRVVGVLREAIAADRVSRRLTGHRSVDVHPTEAWIVTISEKNSAAVVDLATGEPIRDYRPTSSVDTRGLGEMLDVVFGPLGQQIAIHNSFNPPLAVLDLADGGQTSSDSGASVVLGRDNLVFSPDGRNVAWLFETWSFIRVWSISESRTVYDSHPNLPPPGFIMNQSGSTTSNPDFGPTGLLAYAEGDVIRVVTPGTWTVVRSLRVNSERPVELVAWAPDGAFLAVSDRTSVSVIDAGTGREIRRFAGNGVSGIEWIDSSRLAIGNASGLQVVAPHTGETLMVLHGATSPGPSGFDLAAVPDTNSLLVTSQAQGHIVEFDIAPVGGFEVAGWELPWTRSGPARFLSDGQHLVATDGHGSLVVLDARTGSAVSNLTGPEVADSAIVSGDGERVAAPDSAGRWTVRSTGSGELVYEAATGTRIDGLNWAGTMAVVSRGDRCDDAKLIWVADGSVLGDVSPECGTGDLAVQAAPIRYHFAPDDSLILFAGDLIHTEGKGTSLWPSCWCLRSERFGDALSQAATFSPDGAILATGNSEGLLSVFDVTSLATAASAEEALIASIEAHSVPILNIAISADRTLAATSAAGDPLRLWDLATGALIGEFGVRTPGDANYGVFHPSTPHLIVISPSGHVRTHTLDLDELIQIARSKVSRDLTTDECSEYSFAECPSD